MESREFLFCCFRFPTVREKLPARVCYRTIVLTARYLEVSACLQLFRKRFVSSVKLFENSAYFCKIFESESSHQDHSSRNSKSRHRVFHLAPFIVAESIEEVRSLVMPLVIFSDCLSTRTLASAWEELIIFFSIRFSSSKKAEVNNRVTALPTRAHSYQQFFSFKVDRRRVKFFFSSDIYDFRIKINSTQFHFVSWINNSLTRESVVVSHMNGLPHY